MAASSDSERGLAEAFLGDGRGLILLTGVSLAFAGGFAIFLSTAGLLLPHDVAYLGMTTEELCAVQRCRIVNFMIHDRVAFGGALLGIGTLYAWLAQFPLRRREAWAWWVLLVSGVLGFGTFLLYLGYGYLDTWHGIGTLTLMPFFAAGLARSWPGLGGPRDLRTALRPSPLALRTRVDYGRATLLAASAGLALSGIVVMVVGITDVFVPQDAAFIGMSAAELDTVNPRLVPLMAHDRAGFGGAVFVTGLLASWCLWRGWPSRTLRQVIAIVALVGFGSALGVHGIVGYTDLVHVGPAIAAAVAFAVGLALSSEPSADERATATAR